MNVEKIAIWFLGAFVGAGLSVWFSWFWLYGALCGAGVGMVLTVRREAWSFICAIPGAVKGAWNRLVVSTLKEFAAWCGRFKKDMNEDIPKRESVLTDLYLWTVVCHVIGWIFLPILWFLTISSERGHEMLITICFMTVTILVMPLLMMVVAYKEFPRCPIKGDWGLTRYETFIKWKKRAIRYNVVCLPFSVVIFGVIAIWNVCEETDLQVNWRQLVVAIHSRQAVTAAIFCFFGAMVGIMFNHPLGPFIAGFAGMGIGCLEHWAVKKFVLAKWSPTT